MLQISVVVADIASLEGDANVYADRSPACEIAEHSVRRTSRPQSVVVCCSEPELQELFEELLS